MLWSDCYALGKRAVAMEERARFVFEYERDERTMTELCEDLRDLSASVAIGWLRRYRQHGLAGLVEPGPGMLSPHPNQTAVAIEEAVLGSAPGAHALGTAEAEADLGTGSAGRAVGRRRSTMGEMREAARGWWWSAGSVAGQSPTTEPLQHGWNRTVCGGRTLGLVKSGMGRASIRCNQRWHAALSSMRAQGGGEDGHGACAGDLRGRPFASTDCRGGMRTDNGPAVCQLGRGRAVAAAVSCGIKLGIVPSASRPGHPEQNGRTSGCTHAEAELHPAQDWPRPSTGAGPVRDDYTMCRPQRRRWDARRRPACMSLRREELPARRFRSRSIPTRCCVSRSEHVISAGRSMMCFLSEVLWGERGACCR